MSTGTPKKLWDWMSRYVTEPQVPKEAWFDVLDSFRLELIQNIFPHITLRSFEDQEWARMGPQMFPLRSGRPKPRFLTSFDQKLQGSFHQCAELEHDRVSSLSVRRYWGLTRDGKWVSGTLLFPDTKKQGSHNQVPMNVGGDYVSVESLMNWCGVRPLDVVQCLLAHANHMRIEKYRRYQQFRDNLHTLDTFAGIVELKTQAS